MREEGPLAGRSVWEERELENNVRSQPVFELPAIRSFRQVDLNPLGRFLLIVDEYCNLLGRLDALIEDENVDAWK